MNDILSNEVRKGFLKIFILRIVRDHPSHGYEIISEIGKRTAGGWMPSPGSVYPALEYLEVKGYIVGKEEDRKKVYTITAKGENALEQMREKKMQWLKELSAFLGDVLEEDYDSGCH